VLSLQATAQRNVVEARYVAVVHVFLQLTVTHAARSQIGTIIIMASMMRTTVVRQWAWHFASFCAMFASLCIILHDKGDCQCKLDRVGTLICPSLQLMQGHVVPSAQKMRSAARGNVLQRDLTT
jgi:hypothetical protein